MKDARNSVIKGDGAIVLRVTNGYGFTEHHTIVQAVAEADRIVLKDGGTCVVYAPVAVVERAPQTIRRRGAYQVTALDAAQDAVARGESGRCNTHASGTWEE